VPKGWDWWAGLVGNSRYYNYTLSINGKPKDYGSDYDRDYLTDEIGRRANSFLDQGPML
jgi:N-acetylglucosamine-6-sulfatase